ncbi:MAG: hypothetical protein WCD79_16375, partial [Chthoniobacteraceae bacterium]
MKKFLPAIPAVLLFLWLLVSLHVPETDGGFDINAFGKLPVLANGRIKPLDTVARTSLLILHGKEAISDDTGHALKPIEWLMDVMMRPAKADNYKDFLIDNPDVLGLFKWNQSQGRYYSFTELDPFLDQIDQQSKLAENVASSSRNLFQREILKLRDRIILFNQLKNSFHNDESVDFSDEIATFQKAVETGKKAFNDQAAGKAFSKDDLGVLGEFLSRYQFLARMSVIRPVPRQNQQEWKTVGNSLQETIRTGDVDPAIVA